MLWRPARQNVLKFLTTYIYSMSSDLTSLIVFTSQCCIHFFKLTLKLRWVEWLNPGDPQQSKWVRLPDSTTFNFGS